MAEGAKMHWGISAAVLSGREERTKKPAENIRLVSCAHTTTVFLGTIKPSEVDQFAMV